MPFRQSKRQSLLGGFGEIVRGRSYLTAATGEQPMDDQLLRIFQTQIWTQCKFALLALDDLRVQLVDAGAAWDQAQPKYSGLSELSREEMMPAAMEIAMDWPLRAWQPIQAFLTAVANISKAFWGQGGKFAAERATLRVSLGVDESSPIRSTSMRNNFDHFDERLDEWWDESMSHNYVDLSFGNAATVVTGPGIGTKDVFRSFDPETGNLVFWGQTYHLPTMEKEIARIMRVALIAISK
jgi:hypothetical protein